MYNDLKFVDFDPRAAESDPPSASVNNRLRINTQMSSPAIIQNGTTPPPLSKFLINILISNLSIT